MRKGLTVGSGRKGYYNIQGRDPLVHKMSAKGIKQPQRMPNFGGKMPKNISISKHTWSFEKDGNKFKLELGNWSDVGWHWDGNEKDLVSYLIRLKSSEVSNEFLKEMKDNNISFSDLKSQMLKNLDEIDGLYEISGDNSRWHFGQTFTSDSSDGISLFLDDQEEKGYKLTKEQRDKFLNEMNYGDGSANFDEFEREDGGRYKNIMKKAINDSKTFEDFFDALDSVREDYQEIMIERDQELEMNNAFDEFNKFVKAEKIKKN
jgi:hypothetical protein